MSQVTMTQEQMTQEIAKLRAENTRLMTNKSTSDGIKLSSKGGISVYGLGRFPVTLYLSQWETLLGKAEEIKAFAIANADKLASKPTKQ